MSYCRWSSLNWMCDVYCYEDVSGGWITHVAGNRRIREPVPGDADITTSTPEKWAEAHQQTMVDLENIPLEPIGLAHDGETFNDPTLESFRDRLHMLREAEYIVPDYVFEEIKEEMSSSEALA